MEEALRTAMDGYFREVEPMLTTEAERRLREGWGERGRGIEGESDGRDLLLYLSALKPFFNSFHTSNHYSSQRLTDCCSQTIA